MSFIARLLVLAGLGLALLAAMPGVTWQASLTPSLAWDDSAPAEESELPRGDWLHSAADQLPKAALQRSKGEGPTADALVAAVLEPGPWPWPTPSDTILLLAVGLESHAMVWPANARAPPSA